MTFEKIFNKSFDRDEFVKSYKPFKDLNEALRDLKKDYTDPDARQDAGSILWNNPLQYAGVQGDIPRKEIKGSLDERVNQYAGHIDEKGKIVDGYVKRNLNTFLGKLEANELYSIVRRRQPCKNWNSEHDKKVDLWLELKNMQDIAETDNTNLMAEFIANERRYDPGVRNAFLSYSIGDSDYVKRTFANYISQREREFQMEFVTNGKIDKSKVVRYMENNLEAIRIEANKERDMGDKSDLYDLIKPVYLDLAQIHYSKEKKELDKRKDPGRESRREKRAKLGLPV